ncbi:MAG: helix-turn-helix domain-containing protein [Eubacteriales bacterium]|nr:helix-turn-helix domain-containing protein [Eubacteriales bacterium]
MRFNTSNYRSITGKKGISDEEVRKRAGLSEKTFSWILENRFIEVQTLELIADAVGCTAGELSAPDSTMASENCIEWGKDQKCATLTLSQRRIITRVEKLAQFHPGECQIVVRNPDGSICAHVPAEWIRVNPVRVTTEKQKESARCKIREYNLKHGSAPHDLG